MISAFEAKYPGVKVNYVSNGDSNAYGITLMAGIQSGDGADVFGYWPNTQFGQFVQQGVTADLSDMAFVNNLTPGAKELTTVNGKVYGYNDSVNLYVVFYNKDVFSQLNLTPPTTWSEFVTLNNTLKQNGYNGLDYCGATVASQWLFHAIALTEMGASGYAAFMNGMDDGSITSVESVPAFYSSLKSLAQYYTDQILYPNSQTTQLPQSFALFAQKQSVMMQMGTWELGNAATDFPGINIGMFPVPSLSSCDTSYAEPGQVVMINSKSKNLALAKAFVDFMATPENSQLFCDMCNVTPTIKGVTPTFAGADELAALMAGKVEVLQMNNGDNTDLYYNDFYKMTDDILFNGVPVDTAVQAYNAVLQSANIAGQ